MRTVLFQAKFWCWLAGLVASAGFATSSARSAVPDPKMAGRWSGTAEIVVNWTVQRTLRVELLIAPDGVVTGRIGDAALSAGRFERNRGAVGRFLGIKTDFIVTGQLSGQVIAAEGVQRPAVKLPLNWVDETFAGGLHTSGSKFGGKSDMILSATHLKLARSPDLP